MYCEHYNLLRRPFELTPDPAFLYLGEAHREGLATLVYGVSSGKGFVLLTGEVGTGKTTLLHALLGKLDAGTASAFIFNPRLEPLDFFRILFEEYEIGESCRTKAEYLLALNRFLIDRLEGGEPTLLIVDEAQNLSAEMLEEIRLLSNLETPTSKLIQIMLVGQPELKEMLSRPALRQLRQRIALRHHLRPFDEKETAEYVDGRLSKAGYTGKGIFKRSALRELYAVSGGTPRLINSVCDGALLLGYTRGLSTLGGSAIREVALDLELGDNGEALAIRAETGGAARRRGILGLFRSQNRQEDR
jgi:general secretion pathway protein A